MTLPFLLVKFQKSRLKEKFLLLGGILFRKQRKNFVQMSFIPIRLRVLQFPF